MPGDAAVQEQAEVVREVAESKAGPLDPFDQKLMAWVGPFETPLVVKQANSWLSPMAGVPEPLEPAQVSARPVGHIEVTPGTTEVGARRRGGAAPDRAM